MWNVRWKCGGPARPQLAPDRSGNERWPPCKYILALLGSAVDIVSHNGLWGRRI